MHNVILNNYYFAIVQTWLHIFVIKDSLVSTDDLNRQAMDTRR